MTVYNVHRSSRNPVAAPVLGLALAAGWLGSVAPVPVHAQSPAGIPAAAAVQVSSVDFKRGNNGEGRLIVRFDRAGALPDLRNLGDTVVVDVGNAQMPQHLQRALNVTDFATPVQRIDARPMNGGSRLVLTTQGGYESLAYQTGNEYIVEVVPRAGGKAMGAETIAGTIGAKSLERQYTGKPVTFNFQDVPVRTVLQLIAEESGYNLVASDTVGGNVTLRLVNVPWDQALDIILRARGLDKRHEGNVLWIGPQKEISDYELAQNRARIELENTAETITEFLPVSYANAEEIMRLLTQQANNNPQNTGNSVQYQRGLLSLRGTVSADKRTNTLIINDTPDRIARVREFVALIDKPVDQILIESRIVVATDTFARDLGARFGIAGVRSYGDNTAIIGGNIADNVNIRNGDDRVLPSGLNVNLPATGFTSVNPAAIAYTLLGNNFNLDLELSAMQTEGRGEIVSNPRVVTTNQREALIKQGQQIPYTQVQTSTGGNGVAIPTVAFKDVVMELKVTPTLTHDGRVFLDLGIKKDDVREMIPTPGGGTAPALDTREVTTAVLIEDGQTVVIGGVYEFTDRTSLSKVPFLGDIPFLGNLFKQRGRQKNKAELLIFVTPKVIKVTQR